MSTIKILLADDHKLFRETLGFIIDMEPGYKVVASCSDSTEAIEICQAEQPDIILMDINIQPFSGIEATKKIQETAAPARVIAMSAHASPVYVKKMMQVGAKGYVTKNSSKEEIFSAINTVMKGSVYICKEVKDILTNQLLEPDQHNEMASLTAVEMEIIEFIKHGYSTKQIAAEMAISTKKVDAHRCKILKKLNQKNAPALVNFIHQLPPHLFN